MSVFLRISLTIHIDLSYAKINEHILQNFNIKY